MIIICWSVLVPLLLAAGATGSLSTLAVNDTQLAAEVIRNMGKIFDDPKGGPSLLFQQFIEALQQYTKQAVNDAVNLALSRLAPLVGLDDIEDSEEFSSESLHMDPPPMLSLDHRLQFLDRQRNAALQNYMEAFDRYREIKTKMLYAKDLDDQAWLENEKAKMEFYEVRDNYLKIGATNPLENEDYSETLRKWNLTHKQQLNALESLTDVRNLFIDAREQYMHAKEQYNLAQQRYPQIQDPYLHIYEIYPHQEVASVEHEQVSEQSSLMKALVFPERSAVDRENANLPDHIQQPFNSERISTPLLPYSTAALHSNGVLLGPVEDELMREAIEAKAVPDILLSRRRRASSWEILSSLNPLNANLSTFNNVLAGDFSILESLFDDSPQVIYCPATGMKLIRCVRDQFFHGVVKTQIEALGNWFSDFFVPDFYS